MANLLTLGLYKSMQRISSAEHDFILQTHIDSVSRLVKTYCNNSFIDYVSANKTDTFSINWSQHFVQLTESPFISVVTVKERGGIGGDYTTLTSKQYYVDPSTDSVYRSNGASGYQSFPLGPGAVEVVYKAGYTDDSGAAQLPEDLRLAVIDLVTYYFKDQTKARQTIAGASIQNQNTSSQRDNVAFPDHIKRVLYLYKNY